MALRDILILPDKRLRLKSDPVTARLLMSWDSSPAGSNVSRGASLAQPASVNAIPATASGAQRRHGRREDLLEGARTSATEATVALAFFWSRITVRRPFLR